MRAMDRYSWSVGRRLFFALPPEASHRVAGALLGMPLPWRRLGGAVDDPVLATTLAGIPLRNPIGLAAGFDKTCAHLDALGSLGFGYVVGGTITRRPAPATRSRASSGIPRSGPWSTRWACPIPEPRQPRRT